MLTLRIQTRAGIKRLQIEATATVSALKTKIFQEFNIPQEDQDLATRPTPGQGTPQHLKLGGKSLRDYKIQNGDILVLQSPDRTSTVEAGSESPTSSQEPPAHPKHMRLEKGQLVPVQEETEKSVEEDEVDKILKATDGWIDRRDPKKRTATTDDYIAPWCIQQHSPWKELKIKHLPFHSWVKEQAYRSGSNTMPSLVEDTFRVEKSSGRLTGKDIMKSTATITSQAFRHVDHVLFQHRSIVDNFLSGWRASGLQRCGYLIGKYVPDETIPLGIRADVVAIYEPPQQSKNDEVLLLKDDNADLIDALLKRLDLTRVGFIWTNLQVDKSKRLFNDRDPLAPLLPAELIRMANLQARYPSPWQKSRTGKYGSKFVSVLAHGNSDNGVEIDAWMLSNQGVALITEGCIKGSKKDTKNFRVVRAKPDSPYIYPDLIYSERDEYNNVIQKKADPLFPTLFFLIAVRYGFPADPQPLFKSFAFPVENRFDKPLASWSEIRALIDSREPYKTKAMDFHFLLALLLLGAPEPVIDVLVKAVRRPEDVKESDLRSELSKFLDLKMPKTVTVPPAKVAPSPVPARPSPAVTPNPATAAITQELLGMGFSDQQIKEALFVTGGVGGVEAALNFILSSQ